MPLKALILSFAPFLIIAIALVAAIKQYAASFAALGKKPLVYGLLFSVVFSVAIFGTTYISKNLFVVFWIMAAICLLFGIIHYSFTHKRFFGYAKGKVNKLFGAELMFTIAIVCFSIVCFAVLQYFLKDKSFLFYPVLFCFLFFFIPFLWINTFIAVGTIPPAAFPTWEYPLNNPPELPAEKEGERLYVIGFEIAKKAADNQRTFFRAKAPEEMLLGELYYHFINDYNELQSETPIQYMENGKVQSWYFRTKPKWYQRSKILDANLSVHNAGIRENTIIICERIVSQN